MWGVDLGSPVADPYEWPPDDGYLSWHVWFVEGPDRIFVVEDNGYRGNDSEVVAAASRLAGGGRVASAAAVGLDEPGIPQLAEVVGDHRRGGRRSA